jgi:glycosyltransferase involved in cell wall biosynthesis
MNILWLTNVPLPEASQLMNEASTPFGGWLVNASTRLSEEEVISLAIAFPKTGLSDVLTLMGIKKTYYAFPPIGENEPNTSEGSKFLTRILEQAKPDIVHIFGTEYAHTLAMVNACNKLNIAAVISIQGLTSVIAGHYLSGLPVNVQNRFTLRDLIKQDNLKQQQSKFVKRGALEIEALQKVKHVIGRTTWDRACTYQINPDAEYHFCNETLRDEFYNHRWDINHCEKHSIFVSQGSYPIKGLHFMLEAMPLIVKRFPDAKLYIGGTNITQSDTLKDRLKRSSYGKYIEELIGRYNLGQSVVFTGILDEQQMCKQFLQSNVFVSPSIIENESNSLSEAKIMGVPSIASFVGGVTDRIKHYEDGFFYQFDAPYMLAYYVCEIFGNDDLALQFSEKAREHAMRTHDPEINNNTLINIYNRILSDSNRS